MYVFGTGLDKPNRMDQYNMGGICVVTGGTAYREGSIYKEPAQGRDLMTQDRKNARLLIMMSLQVGFKLSAEMMILLLSVTRIHLTTLK